MELYKNWINWFYFGIQRKRLFTGFFAKRYCWFAHDVTAATLMINKKTTSLFGELNFDSCKFYQNSLYDHRYGRLVTWLQTTNFLKVIANSSGHYSVYYGHSSRGCDKGPWAGNFPTATMSMTPGSFHKKKRNKSRTKTNYQPFNSPASTCINPATYNLSDSPTQGTTAK